MESNGLKSIALAANVAHATNLFKRSAHSKLRRNITSGEFLSFSGTLKSSAGDMSMPRDVPIAAAAAPVARPVEAPQIVCQPEEPAVERVKSSRSREESKNSETIVVVGRRRSTITLPNQNVEATKEPEESALPRGESTEHGGLTSEASGMTKSARSKRSGLASSSRTFTAEEPDETTSQQTATLKKIFDEVNVDGNGFLNPQEVLRAMQTFGVAIDEDDVKELIREIDVNEGSKCFSMYAPASQRLIDFDLDDEESPREPRIIFEDFQKLIFLWQSAARFQLFEERTDETLQHVREAIHRRFLIPDSLFAWMWQVVMLVIATYLILVAAAVFTNTSEEKAQFFAAYTGPDAAVTIFLIADIVIKFNSCVTVERNGVTFVVDDRAGIAREYMTSVWFWIDLLTVMPLRFLCAAGGDPTYLLRVDNATDALLNARESGCVGCVTGADYEAKMIGATVLTVIRALKYVEHYRYFAETSLTPMTRWYIWRQFVVGHLLALVSNFVVCVHTLSVIFLSIDRYRSTVGSVGLGGGVVRYAEALYLVLYCMATVGLGDVRPEGDDQRWFLIFLCICGSLFSAYVIGSMVGFFQRSDIAMDRQKKLLEMVNVLEYFSIPNALAVEVLSFQNYLLQNSLTKSYGSVVNELPADMQRNLELWTRIQAVNTMPVIRDGHRSAKLQICNSLIEVAFCPEEYVFLIGEIGEEMFFINHGFVDLLDEHSGLIATRKPGEYFGELAAFQLKTTVRSTDAKCITYCEFFVLGRSEFMEVQKRYPRVQKSVEELVRTRDAGDQSQMEMAVSVRFTAAMSQRRGNVTVVDGDDFFRSPSSSDFSRHGPNDAHDDHSVNDGPQEQLKEMEIAPPLGDFVKAAEELRGSPLLRNNSMDAVRAQVSRTPVAHLDNPPLTVMGSSPGAQSLTIQRGSLIHKKLKTVKGTHSSSDPLNPAGDATPEENENFTFYKQDSLAVPVGPGGLNLSSTSMGSDRHIQVPDGIQVPSTSSARLLQRHDVGVGLGSLTSNRGAPSPQQALSKAMGKSMSTSSPCPIDLFCISDEERGHLRSELQKLGPTAMMDLLEMFFCDAIETETLLEAHAA